jgi:hypothetical protein
LTDIVLRTKLSKYLALREEVKDLKKEMEDTRDEILPYIADMGRENAAGSKVVSLDIPVKLGEDNFVGMQHTRKVRQFFNEDAVREWFDSVSEEDYTDTHRTIQTLLTKNLQDELWELFVQEKITEETMATFTGEQISWSFNPIAE